MVRRSSRPRPQHPLQAPPGGGPDLKPVGHPSTPHVRREIFMALVVMVLMTLVKMGFEHTADGEALQFLTYDRQQEEAARHHASRPLPVVVADITALRPVPSPGAPDLEPAVPRGPLLTLLRELANRGARAIGVDIDFSPEGGVYRPEDAGFLHACLDLRGLNHRRVPVYLGVWRSQALPAQRWLGGEELAAHAASLAGPRADRRKMPAWTVQSGERPLFSLALQLAHEQPQPRSPVEEWYQQAGEAPVAPAAAGARPPRADGGRWPERLAEQVVRRPVDRQFTAYEFLVDYSPAEQLMAERLLVDGAGRLPRAIPAERIWDKLVLVGNGTPDRSTDMTRLPGHPDEVPGVYAHACAVHTLVERPLYALSEGFRLLLDPALGLVLIAVVFGARALLERQGHAPASSHRLELLTILILVTVTWMVGANAPIWFGLVWTDYVLVFLALLLHPYAGTVWEGICERFSRPRPPASSPPGTSTEGAS